MAIRTKLTTRGDRDNTGSGRSGREGERPERSEEERATRKARVAAAKDALSRSANLRGDHVPPARAALKAYLRNLDTRRQPSDEQFAALVEGPFRAPPKRPGARR